jgi:hypothetical protein
VLENVPRHIQKSNIPLAFITTSAMAPNWLLTVFKGRFAPNLPQKVGMLDAFDERFIRSINV